MADILHEVIIEGTPEKIYQALTEQNGLASWWTTHASARPEVGSIGEFRFMDGQFIIKVKVVELEEPKKVSWASVQGAPDWGDTQMTWDLSPADLGTKVLFGHRNFASTDGSFASVSYNWAWYITSLKSYIETGKGTPHTY